MKPRWIIAGVLLGPFAVLLAIFLADELLDRWLVVHKGPVGGKIRRAVLMDGATSVNIASLTSFDWSEFRLYGPYQYREEICEAEKLAWLACRKVPESVNETEFLLLFRTAQGAVYMERHDRDEGDFANSGAPRLMVPSTAVFEIVRTGSTSGRYAPWVLLRWQP